MFPKEAKIMVLDDSSVSRKAVVEGLKSLQYWKIIEVADARSAQNRISDEERGGAPVQLIFCDIHMPEMSGLQFVKWLRGRSASRGIPVIIVTASQDRMEVVEAAKLGVSHFMIKPFDNAVLSNRISSVWERVSASASGAKGPAAT